MGNDRLIRRHIRTRYVVTMRGEQTFDGLLDEADAKHLVLVDACVLAANGDRTKVDGRLWLPRNEIAYMQQPKA